MPRPYARVAPALALLFAACGDLPQPFAGRPGPTAARLVQPPPARLAVPTPTHALLTDAAADTLAGAVADALVEREVPAVAHAAKPGDWQLVVSAELKGARVVPTYTVRDERGRPQGTAIGVAMPPHAWSDGDPYMLKMEAAAIAPKITEMLVGIDAARKRSDPHSLYNRPPQVAVLQVTGAPGDGNLALTRHMRAQLPKLGDILQDAPEGADFTVAGRVHTAPGAGNSTRVEIQWLINDAAGHDLGRVVQINEVPAGSITPFWGDVALVVAQEAAGGVQDVILRQSGRRAAGDATPASQREGGKAPPDQH